MNQRTLLKTLSTGIHTFLPEPDSSRIADRTAAIYHDCCRAHQDDPPALKEHTEGMIYGGAALYLALQENGMSKEKALAMTDRIFQNFSEKAAGMLRRLLRFPGLYRLIPWAFRTVVPKKYSTASGFQFRFYDVGRRRVKFDMTACPYASTCAAMGCPELTTVFCNTDDCCYGNMHPRLRWNRTRTIGRGADLCDFDIIVTK